MGRSSDHSSLRPLTWPGLAGKVCVSDKWGQPTPSPAYPVLTVPSPGLGSLQVRLRASIAGSTQICRSPGLGFQVDAQAACVWRGHTGMVGASWSVCWSPALGVCWGARPKEPQKAVGDQSQQEGREEGVGLRKGFQEGRAEREEEAKESRLPFLQLL